MSPLATAPLKILLIGCGNMGRALLDGWLAHGMTARAVVVEPKADNVPTGPQLLAVPDATGIPTDFTPDVVVFAVKPQSLPDIVAQYARFATGSAVFLSIVAGKTIGFLERSLGSHARIVRAMPNTPASIHAGITVACPNKYVTGDDRHRIGHLLQAVGDVVWVDDEGLINPVTALSGSGPAYVFLMIEAMARAGEKLGLPVPMADRLARATVYGSGLLARKEASTPAERLRRNVTSPGGTTEAALGHMMDAQSGLPALMERALAAASKRAKELED